MGRYKYDHAALVSHTSFRCTSDNGFYPQKPPLRRVSDDVLDPFFRHLFPLGSPKGDNSLASPEG